MVRSRQELRGFFRLAAIAATLGCGHSLSVAPPAGPTGAGSPTPSAAEGPRPGAAAPSPAQESAPASPAPLPPPRPFAFSLGPDALLFYYDPASREVYPVPGAGSGVFNPYFMDDDRRISFGQEGRLWAWDLEREQKILFSGTDDLGPVFAPDVNGELMLFHSATDVFVWHRLGWPGPWPTKEFPLSPWASPPPEPSPSPEAAPEPSRKPTAGPPAAPARGRSPEPAARESARASDGSSSEPSPAPIPPYPAGMVGSIAPLKVLGALHGGIFDARIDDPGKTIVATTGDGALWVYWRETATLRQIAAVRALGDGQVRTLDIDLPGRMVVVSTDIHLYMIDLYTGLIDPLPFANMAFNSVRFFSPTWITADEFYYLAEDSAGRLRILLYNWRTEAVRALTLVNNVLDAERNRISDPN